MPKDSASVLRRLLRLVKDSYDYLRFPSTRHRGVYRSFDEALAAIPPGRKSRASCERLANAYKADFENRLESGDFPHIFLLGRTLQERDTVLDVGGNVGIHFLRCRKYLPQSMLRWIVLETPELAAAGREICAGVPEVRFIDDLAQIGSAQIQFFFGCGSFQYARKPARFLEALRERGMPWPHHALIDQIPLHEGPEYLTVQNVGGLVYRPHYVFNRVEFEQEMTGLGYKARESWANQGMGCMVPFHRDRAVPDFSGYFFARRP